MLSTRVRAAGKKKKDKIKPHRLNAHVVGVEHRVAAPIHGEVQGAHPRPMKSRVVTHVLPWNGGRSVVFFFTILNNKKQMIILLFV